MATAEGQLAVARALAPATPRRPARPWVLLRRVLPSRPQPARHAPGPSRAVRHARRARRAVLWGLACYAVVVLLLNLVCDHWPHSLCNLWWQKWRSLQQLVATSPDRPLLVALGSSRAEAGLEAGLLNDLPGPGGRPFLAYNFSVSGTGPLGEALSLHEMLAAGIRPRLVLAEFVPPLLNDMRKGCVSEEYWLSPGRLTLSQVLFLQPYLGRADHVRRNWLQARLAPWYVMRPWLQLWGQAVLSGSPTEAPPPWDAWGYHCLAQQPPKVRRTLRDLTYDQYAKSLGTFELGAGPVQAMRDVLERCRHEGIPAVLFIMPESRWFGRMYSPQGLAALRGLLEQLRDEYGLPVIDGTDWCAASEFQDGHHLMAKGAHEFTLRLRGELQRILATSPQ
jgi:hypothetical protein